MRSSQDPKRRAMHFASYHSPPYLYTPLNYSSLPIYRPNPIPPCCAIAAFCSWNRSPNRSELLRNLSTHRITQPSSLLARLLDVKSVTQSLKQRWTRLEYIYIQVNSTCHRDGLNHRKSHTFMKSFICFLSMRPCSSRCSAAFSLRLLLAR